VIKLSWDNKFKRSFKKKTERNPKLKQQFQQAVELFTKNPFDPKLKTHKLKGKLEGLWAFSTSYEQRVIFTFLHKQKEALFIDIGTHDEVY